MSVRREFQESPIRQGIDEEVAYSFPTTPWGSDPTNVSVVVKDRSQDYADVTLTVMPGSPSVSGDDITLPALKNLTEHHTYRVEVKFTIDGNVFEAWGWFHAEL